MFNHILVPLDGSHLAEAALPPSLELASKFNSELTLTYVIQPPHLIMTAANGSVYSQLLTEMRNQSEQDAESYLRSHKGSLQQQGFTVHAQITEGENVADSLLDVAANLDIDTIVMSTHGRGGISRWVFGSVADKVLRYANVPVLFIRAKEETADYQRPPLEVTI
ncbi:universal stress protein [Candidatus Leptofilum sp.]|uniref:universal stress protein n=1 Tax=Candidatus Leptofilum sp. TaxID=3241576 RepID=UPI003B596591